MINIFNVQYLALCLIKIILLFSMQFTQQGFEEFFKKLFFLVIVIFYLV